jgi:hypothetical protein
MKSNWVGKYRRTNTSTAVRLVSSVVALPRRTSASRKKGNSERRE